MASSGSNRRFLKWVWLITLSPLIFLCMLFGYIFLFEELPSLQELENPKSNLASEVISADQKVLGKYYVENRTNVKFQQISPNVINALVATEDARFFSHSGVDARALVRAVTGVVRGSESSGGGSTISQQLAKMLFPREELNGFEIVFRKFKEWIIAVRLEKNYTKQEILAMYLNKFDFINNAVGIKSAARIYFNTTPDSLKMEQAATLVGMAKNPALFNPVRRLEKTQERRNVVLSQMKKYKYITPAQYDSLKAIPLKLSFQAEDHNQGTATYFREYLRDYMKQWCRENVKPDGSHYDLYKDGLKIYTSLNSKMQKYAEEAVVEWLGKELQPSFFKHWKGKKEAPFYSMNSKEIQQLMLTSMRRSERYRVLKKAGMSEEEIIENFKKPVPMTIFTWQGERDTVLTPNDSMRYYKHFLQTGLMAMEPQTGYVRAWVGGINYKHFKYDHVRQGRRQVGSTFKPFVYALAMQERWSPCYMVPNLPVTFELPEGGTWTPRNSDAKYGGMMTLKKGLATSTNTITAYVLKQFGPQAVVDLSRKLGIESPLDPVPSLCLGTADISLYEMVGANAAFANKGVWTEPIFITRIEDKDGNVLQEFIPRRVEALNEETAFLTLNLMKGVTDYGTGIRLRYKYKINTPVAGKTGTTQNNSDGWFIGITPDIVAGCWVGCEDRSAHFRSTELGQGAHMALPIWAKFMQKVYADNQLKVSKGDFEKPDKDISIELDCTKKDKDDGSQDPIDPFDPDGGW